MKEAQNIAGIQKKETSVVKSTLIMAGLKSFLLMRVFINEVKTYKKGNNAWLSKYFISKKYAKKENAWDAIVIRGNLPLKLFAQIWTLITTLVS